MLGFETQQVMHLRMMKLFAGGPEAQSEALRMVTEKDQRFDRGYDDASPRRVGAEGYPTISNPRQIEPSTIIETVDARWMIGVAY